MSALPHVNAGFNALCTVLLVAGLVAIRRGDRVVHPKLMVGAIVVGACFLVGYVVQVGLAGHKHFPGHDWVRTVFLVILGTHTLLAVIVAPLVLTAAVLAKKKRFVAHRRLARVAAPIWLYVSGTGLVIYWMTNHLRPS